ncbi:acetyltransferase [Brevibacillus choshinensis]|uniref:Acetyltransferase n=1 Tax=Brevibacillus choshinensis TaxID=54911 RepID=A0ABR5NAK2_BRECH|nr:GNAT family N-acetyltransferase [Brevibacillus choshinensis]KQL48577.1 acetyltransferase [Brevibacillus choshinensis]
MEEIRPISLEDINEVVRITAMAYPGSNLLAPENQKRFTERVRDTLDNDQNASFHGLFREQRLVGVMKWHDLPMNVHGVPLLTGGIGTVAVDLLHKKEKVAKAMLRGFLTTYRERGVSLVSLYPFRVDFYKKMGFGVGTKINQYRIKPASLPYTSKDQVFYLGEADREQILACYHRIVRQTHGMIKKTERELKSFLEQPEQVVVGYKKEGKINGYLVFQFQRCHDENRLQNDIVVKEFLYETYEAMAQLLSFLQSQSDQINRIVLTTADEDFHVLLSDPGNGTDRILPSVYHESHVSGVGLMYRVIDVTGFFHQLSQRRFGKESCLLRLNIRDTFLPENEGSWLIDFREGLPHVIEEGTADVELGMDISDFSSLVMGAVGLRKLHLYGLAEVSDEKAIPLLDRLFAAREKPRSTTPF